MSFFATLTSNVRNYFFGQRFQQKFQNDRARAIYNAINWETSVIGGSYALHQFHDQFNPQNQNWTPDDIDIMVGSQTPEEFQHEAKQFEQKCPEAELLKWSRRTEYNKTEFYDVKTQESQIRNYAEMIDDPGDAEVFHDTVHGSRTYQHPTAGKIQLVDIRTTPEQDLQTTLAMNTDTPACVNYTMTSYEAITDQDYLKHGRTVHTRIWHFPEKGREILLTSQGPESDICPNRKTKYEQRGYTFYNRN